MPLHEPHTLDQPLPDSRQRATHYAPWLAQVRTDDRTFAEASTPYPADMNEWQATYLLTGCEQLWTAVEPEVRCDPSMAAVIRELDQPRRACSSSQEAVMRWGAHSWEVDRSKVSSPYVFKHFYFPRWIIASHPYKRVPPTPSTTNGSLR